MMNRFCRYIDKCFHFQQLLPLFRDARQKSRTSPVRPSSPVSSRLFAGNRTSLNSLEKDLVGLPQRRAVWSASRHSGSIDTLGRVYISCG